MHTICCCINFILLLAICTSKAPNIIFILSDDLGFDDVGYESVDHQIETPNLDQFASEGRLLKYYYGQPVCSPTRTAIMTGKYPLHSGINGAINVAEAFGVPLSNTMLPQILLNNNYSTHAIGKWHMGFYKWSYTPTFRGFQSFYGYYGGGEDYYTHIADDAFDFHEENGIECGPNCSRIATETYGTYSVNLFSERAIDIIKNHTINNKDKSLFLYLAYQSVHGPTEVPQSYIDLYNNTITNKTRLTKAAMLTAMDEGIGNISSVLQANGYLDDTGNTMIIWVSDNGAQIGEGGINWPLRGGKFTVWEGGCHLAGFIWSTTDLIPNNLRSVNYTQLMHAVDWLPTLLAAANININTSIDYSIDGVNQWNGIIGKDKDVKKYNDEYFMYRDSVYYGYPVGGGGHHNHSQQEIAKKPDNTYNNTAFRYQWNKLINGTGGEPDGWYNQPSISNVINTNNYSKLQLFNLENDLSEYNDISSNNTEIVNKLYNMMIELEKTGIHQIKPDGNCPNITHPNNSVVGPVWTPWCGM